MKCCQQIGGINPFTKLINDNFVDNITFDQHFLKKIFLCGYIVLYFQALVKSLSIVVLR